jgi:hypothetical protein
LTATSRRSRRSRPPQTSPIPPCPRRPSMRYQPERPRIPPERATLRLAREADDTPRQTRPDKAPHYPCSRRSR